MLTLTHNLAEAIHPQLYMLLGVGVIVLTLLWSSHRRRSRPRQAELRVGVHARHHAQRMELQARDDVDELMVRLEELSREICGQVDTRFAKLERILAEADGKLEQLRAATARARSAAASPSAEAAEINPEHAAIIDLAQQGSSSVEIARQRGLSVGEVELILSLHKRRPRRDDRPAADDADAPRDVPAAPPASIDRRA